MLLSDRPVGEVVLEVHTHSKRERAGKKNKRLGGKASSGPEEVEARGQHQSEVGVKINRCLMNSASVRPGTAILRFNDDDDGDGCDG